MEILRANLAIVHSNCTNQEVLNRSATNRSATRNLPISHVPFVVHLVGSWQQIRIPDYHITAMIKISCGQFECLVEVKAHPFE